MPNDVLVNAIGIGLETKNIELYGVEYAVPVWAKHVAVDEDGWITVFEAVPVWNKTKFVRLDDVDSKSMVITRSAQMGKTLLKSIN